jgi:hypothetical protein
MLHITNRIQALSATLLAIAGVLVAAGPACPTATYEKPFANWNDNASYVLAPDGGFEAKDGKWALSGDAAIAGENESFRVRCATDTSSLQLPAGSSATSSQMSIGLEYPTLRFFARTEAPGDGRLTVHVLFNTPDGTPRQLRIAELGAGVKWQPTRTVFILANLLALYPGWDRKVAFRFTATSGTWGVDDVYVDPYER